MGRGKNSSLRKYLRKKGSRNIIDERRLKIEELRKSQSERQQKKLKAAEEELGPALGGLRGKPHSLYRLRRPAVYMIA